MEDALKLNYPGLAIETLPSGNKRYRVRVAGNAQRWITLKVPPDHKAFQEAYHAARAGVQFIPEVEPEEKAIRNSISWLTYKHLADLKRQVAAGQASALTLKKREGLMQRLRNHCGEYSLKMPTSEVIKLRDSMIDTPASADSMVEAIRAMYKWAISIGLCDHNPAVGIPRIDKGRGGAVPWEQEDLKAFRERWPIGTTPHLALTLFMFTACRIGDAIHLGRHNESTIQGVQALGWQPRKKNSEYVEIPLLPPLFEATRAVKVFGPDLPYLLKSNGKPYGSADHLGQDFKKWCRMAGVENRSAHGIRKAAGHLLALQGCTQYQIMCIHGHSSAKTSEIYTKGVERWHLARDAMAKLQGMEW